MSNTDSEFWRQSLGQAQQSFADNWTTAMQSVLGALPEQFRPGAGNAPAPLPQIAFSPSKLQELQQQYLRDAAELWNNAGAGNAALTTPNWGATKGVKIWDWSMIRSVLLAFG